MTHQFVKEWNDIARLVHQNAAAKGFWDKPRNFGEMIALMHSEMSEALEAHRYGNPVSDVIPPFRCVEEELADCVIRIMDLAAGEGYNVAEALMAKTGYNARRPYKTSTRSNSNQRRLKCTSRK